MLKEGDAIATDVAMIVAMQHRANSNKVPVNSNNY